MSKREEAFTAAGLWLSGLGLAAAVAFASHRPVHAVGPAQLSASQQGESQLLPAEEEMVGTSELELPTLVIDDRPGVTAMQRDDDDLVIGPGVVTHP